MPEIVEVEIIRKWLNDNYSGCIIRESERYPEIINTIIDSVSRKGKQIFFKLLNSKREVMYLNSRLGLQGKWSNIKGNNTRFWLKLERIDVPFLKIKLNEHNSINVITTELMLYNDDSMNFGDIELLTNEQYVNKLEQLGPDFLNDYIDPKLWYSKLKNGRIKNKQICDFLMEQKYFSGIGNYLKSEILYHAKVRPDRTLNSLTDEEIYTLRNSALFIISESYKYGGLTIQSFWSPEGERGKYPRKVYDKEKDPNGYTVIVSHLKDKRTTYWVAEIQK